MKSGSLPGLLRDSYTKTNNSEQNSQHGEICTPRSSADENWILLGRYPVSIGDISKDPTAFIFMVK
jgi:hypothetical protein